MSTIVKVLGTEISVATANDVGTAHLVRLTNTGGTAAVVTVANTGGTIGTLTLRGNSEIIVQKAYTDTVQGTGVLAVKIAFSH